MSTCPHCSNSTIWNGHHPGGKQKFMCHSCSWQHVQNPQDRCVSELSEEIRELLRERISQGINGVSAACSNSCKADNSTGDPFSQNLVKLLPDAPCVC